MNPDDILSDYKCMFEVNNYRVGVKVEYQLVTRISFFSSRYGCEASTTWTMWRSFNLFKATDTELRSQYPFIMKDIKFARLHRSRSIFGATKSTNFLTYRMKELDHYMKTLASKENLTVFHKKKDSNKILKNFIGFIGGFGSNSWYSDLAAHVNLERKCNRYAPSSFAEVRRCSNNSSITTTSTSGSFTLLNKDLSTEIIHGDQLSFTHSLPHKVPQKSQLKQIRKVTTSKSFKVEDERLIMEQYLTKQGLKGVGMPPDGSCFLHCLVFEMYPLGCLRGCDPTFTTVNIGLLDGSAPRRMAAAKQLRRLLMEYAIDNLYELSSFLMQDETELRERYKLFGESSSEQATVAELYASACLFNVEIRLITNDEYFHVDIVKPISNVKPIRRGQCRQLVLGYLIPRDAVPGHYICTRSIARQDDTIKKMVSRLDSKEYNSVFSKVDSNSPLEDDNEENQ